MVGLVKLKVCISLNGSKLGMAENSAVCHWLIISSIETSLGKLETCDYLFIRMCCIRETLLEHKILFVEDVW